MVGPWDVEVRLFFHKVQIPKAWSSLDWGLCPWFPCHQIGNETLFASSCSCFSSSEDAMEYSKEFVTAVVLGKDLVPRQVEKCVNSLMNLCCSVPNHLFPVRNTWTISVSGFLIFLSLYCSLFLVLCHCVFPGHLCWGFYRQILPV